MPPFLISLLGSRLAWSALGLAALLGLAGVQTLRLNHAKADLAAARAAAVDPLTKKAWQVEAKASGDGLAVCQSSLGQLNGALSSQSAALSSLRSQDATTTAAAQTALDKAQAEARAAAARAAAILAAPAPASACAASDALILKSVTP